MKDISKVVHCKKEKYDVYVGRPSKFGNPFLIDIESNRENVLVAYEQYLLDNPKLVKEMKKELSGKILGCWCSPKPCHADIILEFIK